jgi:hypothetical protein
MITLDELRTFVRYDQDTGNFVWLVKRPGNNFSGVGKVAGRISNQGYVQVQINGRRYQGHRLAWLYVRGEWPSGEIDHINGCKADNRFVNLRSATRSQNQANNSVSLRNRSGRKGVGWNAKVGKWQVQIGVRGKIIYLGLFDDIDMASNVYAKAATSFFGEFARS